MLSEQELKRIEVDVAGEYLNPEGGLDLQDIEHLIADHRAFTAQLAALKAELDSETAWAAQYKAQATNLEDQVRAFDSECLRLTALLAEAQHALEFHPRAAKLMHKGKPFLVIAIDEPYFMDAYKLIKTSQVLRGTWTDEDQVLLEKLMDEHSERAGCGPEALADISGQAEHEGYLTPHYEFFLIDLLPETQAALNDARKHE